MINLHHLVLLAPWSSSFVGRGAVDAVCALVVSAAVLALTVLSIPETLGSYSTILHSVIGSRLTLSIIEAHSTRDRLSISAPISAPNYRIAVAVGGDPSNGNGRPILDFLTSVDAHLTHICLLVLRQELHPIIGELSFAKNSESSSFEWSSIMTSSHYAARML
ncbi:hypothetical protein BDN71DRAFT_884024 [Pleurotus eryngii]|uniref:Uncharacterized protein n=1 Tax=Pleurotus eryngii TaxID=5323 RepID=A0A9P5ZGM1_PLEER|nr:hypothetical protein BDN71DRAFT_884024 [Pleurotus eryngii]